MAVARTDAPPMANCIESHAGEAEPVAIRPLGADQLTLFRDHLLRLPPECRGARFGMRVGDRFIRQYVTTARALSTTIIAYIEDHTVRGTAELRPVGDSRSAEVALSVEAPWRRKGVGTSLMHQLIDTAAHQDVHHIYFRFLAGNVAMKSLAAKFTMDMALDDIDLVGKIDPTGCSNCPASSPSYPTPTGWLGAIHSFFGR